MLVLVTSTDSLDILNRFKSEGCQIAKHCNSIAYGHEKGPSEDDPFVIRTRFERVTDCLEGSCSIQLSYRTIIYIGYIAKAMSLHCMGSI